MSIPTKGQVDTSDPIVSAFKNGDLLVYPTEAVMGIGCDPDNEAAVLALLALKQRPIEKGVILIAANYSQLLPYINDEAILQHRRTEIVSSWPGPNTWLLPKSASTPQWLTGKHEKIAVRVSNHPVVKALCEKLEKPLVSTSANLTGQQPAITQQDAINIFGDSVFYIDGEVGGHAKPSTIRDGDTGEIIRS
ncbi:L-threonylcarbamoyladenylate synthase type 1 TsaC [Alteromonas sp. KS69]|jgi:L-threonylcarbamoyladenylate synthase|uniref:Sua5/YciO/YrdC/YwlC family protein n=1 Tax=Alteromonas TaxID=226 RepID=UPI000F85CF72|nr:MULTISPECIES: Sua5/YciO/YrdC/YwlC family protein [Alteromonas]RUP83680.1 L-threonylcarbamoyladenylate synthase type 1 TsaC [Alteromonas sp. KS69]CAD5245986.1 putative ribosome maturation factor [Alteromonas sp. 154]VXC58293.1 putative ribosome maturation factor [Alteromonas sp. 38]